jgi:hypothetical protein
LLAIKLKLQELEGAANADLAKGLLGEAQVLFDRYLRTYAKQSRKREHRGVEDAVELKEFKLKWNEFVLDDVQASDDIRPMLGLDAYEAPPKPYRIHQKYDTTALHRGQARLIVDHEIAKLKQDREHLR